MLRTTDMIINSGRANVGPVVSSSEAQKVRDKAKAMGLGSNFEEGKSESATAAATASKPEETGDAEAKNGAKTSETGK